MVDMDTNPIEWWILAGLVALLFVGMIYIMASYKPSVQTSCKPSWSCSEFGACIDGLKSRTCIDTSGCGNYSGLPYLTDKCGSTTPTPTNPTQNQSTTTNQTIPNTEPSPLPVTTPCVENWACSIWYECTILGVQKRTCDDTNHCGTTLSKPELERECVINFDTNAIAGRYNIAGTWIIVEGLNYKFYGSSSYHCIPADIILRTPEGDPICSRAGYDSQTERVYLEYQNMGLIYKRDLGSF